jgi:hypothetical protein
LVLVLGSILNDKKKPRPGLLLIRLRQLLRIDYGSLGSARVEFQPEALLWILLSTFSHACLETELTTFFCCVFALKPSKILLLSYFFPTSFLLLSYKNTISFLVSVEAGGEKEKTQKWKIKPNGKRKREKLRNSKTPKKEKLFKKS